MAGRYRRVCPEMTLEAALSVAGLLGVTRCADITGLDVLGIPVYCAIRPLGVTLQVANGKGCRAIEARVSALMEAIEHACVERVPGGLVWASPKDLNRRGLEFVQPSALQGFLGGLLYNEDRILPWSKAEILPLGKEVLLPAPFVYAMEPALYAWSTNGLASGNDAEEATLHAIYEVCERHSLSLLASGDEVRFDGCQTIDVSSIDAALLHPLLDCIERAGARLILLRVDLDWRLHTFLAVLLDNAFFRGRRS
jgi:ribosomal protein S12 methylthiotransferase accessory factor